MYCKANGCIHRPYKTVDGFVDAWNDALGLIPAAFAACVVIIHIIWVFVRDLIQENVDLSFLLDDDAEGVGATSLAVIPKYQKDISTSTLLTKNTPVSSQLREPRPRAAATSASLSVFNRPASNSLPDTKLSQVADATVRPTSVMQGRMSTTSTRAVHSGHTGLDTDSSDRVTRSMTLDIESLRSGATDSAAFSLDSPGRTQSGRRNPVSDQLGLTSRGPNRGLSTAKEPPSVSTVSRGCSPIRCYNAAPQVPYRQCKARAETWRSSPRRSPDISKYSSTASGPTGSSVLKSYDDHVNCGRVGVRFVDRHAARATRPSVDCRRQTLDQERYVRVLKSNRALEKFMDVIRQEKEAKATAALFSAPSTGCRRRISFAPDKGPSHVTSLDVTSSCVGSGHPCRRDSKLVRSTTSGHCSTESGRQSFNDLHLRQLKQQANVDHSAMRLREIEEDWNKYLEYRTKSSVPRTSTPRPVY